MVSKYGAGLIFLLKLTTALEISPDGTCGGVQEYICGEAENPCCSQYGWCGATSDHCGTGCQSGFGTCNETSSQTGSLTSTSFTTMLTVTKTSSSSVSSDGTSTLIPDASTASADSTTALTGIPSPLAATSTALSLAPSSSAGANAQSCTCSNTVDINPTCPTNDGACYTVNGKTFTISCGGLAEGDVIGYPPILSLSTCISTCSMISNCVAVSFLKQGTPECALLSKYSGPATDSETGTKAVARLQGASCT